MLALFLFSSIVSSALFYLLARTNGFIITFSILVLCHGVIFLYLNNPAGGWYIMLIQIPTAFFNLVACSFSAGQKWLADGEKKDTQKPPSH
jgi:hypothetical protein